MELGVNGKIPAGQTTSLQGRLARNRDGGDDAVPVAIPAPQDSIFLTADKTAPKTVKISFLPQDPGITPQENVDVDATGLKDGLVGPRVRVAETRDFPVPHADADGNYIFQPDNPRFDAGEDYVASTRALGMAEKYLGRELPWGFSKDLGRDQLIVHPHLASGVANAFYSSDAGSLNFFEFKDPKTNEIMRTGMSSDVAAHETGHALLDAIRHDYISSLSMASAGFHESFADCTAMLTALQDDSVLDRLQADTNGDLSQPNCISNLAELLGRGIADAEGTPDTGYLRTALNNNKYADEHFLPYIDPKHPNTGLGQEPHAYSSLFTGSFYDILQGLYQKDAADTGKTFKQAVAQARDQAGQLLFRGMEFAPVGDVTLKGVALAMIKADQVDNGGANRDLLASVFKNRDIVSDADLKAFDAHEAALPKLTLDAAAMKDKAGAQSFLDAHRDALGVPGDVKPKLEEMHTNDRGETFMQYDFERSFSLDGTDFGQLDGSKVKATGGVLLAFDKSGNLIEDNVDDVTQREVEDIQDHLKVAVANGAISMDENQGGKTPAGAAYLNLAETAGPSGPMLQRAPIIWG